MLVSVLFSFAFSFVLLQLSGGMTQVKSMFGPCSAIYDVYISINHTNILSQQ